MKIEETKQALRQAAKARRDELTIDQRLLAASAIVAHATDVYALGSSRAPVMSAYLAIGSELDPSPLMQNLQRLGATIALPVMVGKTLPLEFRAWQPGEELVDRQWGIREPAATCSVVFPDVFLVPLLSVDKLGTRLGYGGGYYDRTLAKARRLGPCVAVGVAYASQMVDAVPQAAYDEPLNFLLTPNGLAALQ